MVERPKIRHGLFGQRLDWKLPKMVDWFDPLLLGAVAVRTMISTTIGQYADQRPIQAAMDREDDPSKLALRHDLSSTDPMSPERNLKRDADGNVWVDFIADLGDGFEATYAMAYLMASPSLHLAGIGTPGETLNAGEVLILGGDHAYPNATVDEYQSRCLDPYNAAFRPQSTSGGKDTPAPRKLFFVAGNHDWYDGLAAFTSVFCAARSKGHNGLKIGGWQSEQRRSYFALKLPHDWWIWGIDAGLSDNIDVAQWRYFEAAAGKLQDHDKIIVVTHTPAWIDKKDDSLTDIVELVRDTAAANNKTGVEIRAVLAGDLHHYSHYVSDIEDHPPVHLITSGGGGAFLHPTHNLKKKSHTRWPSRLASHAESTSPAVTLLGKVKKGMETLHTFNASKVFYPSRARSRFLALKNFWLAFHNKRFAILLGLIYFLFAWVYHTSDLQKADYQIPPGLAKTSDNEAQAIGVMASGVLDQEGPVLRRFLDLASGQDATKDLKAAAEEARTQLGWLILEQGAAKATSADLIAAEIAKHDADFLVAQLSIGRPKSKPASSHGRTPNTGTASSHVGGSNSRSPTTDAPATTVAPLSDADKKLDEAVNLAKDKARIYELVRSRAEAARRQAYVRSEYVFRNFYKALQQLDVDAEALRKDPEIWLKLSKAAADAKSAILQARSLVDQAKLVEERKTVLEKAKAAFDESQKDKTSKWGLVIDHAKRNPAFAFMLLGLLAALIYYVDADIASPWFRWLNWPVKFLFGWYHFKFHIAALLWVDWIAQGLNAVFLVLQTITFLIGKVLWVMIKAAWSAVGPMLRLTHDKHASEASAHKAMEDMMNNMGGQLKDSLSPIGKCFTTGGDITSSMNWNKGFESLGNCLADQSHGALELTSFLSYLTTSVFLGGLLGASIFGFYWVLTSSLFGMHIDGFSALGMRGYKNFLRMRFERDKITVYAIGLRKVPGRRGWRSPKPDEAVPDHNPEIVPKKPLKPHLIETFEISKI